MIPTGSVSIITLLLEAMILVVDAATEQVLPKGGSLRDSDVQKKSVQMVPFCDLTLMIELLFHENSGPENRAGQIILS